MECKRRLLFGELRFVRRMGVTVLQQALYQTQVYDDGTVLYSDPLEWRDVPTYDWNQAPPTVVEQGMTMAVEDKQNDVIPDIDIPLTQVPVEAKPAPMAAVLANEKDLKTATSHIEFVRKWLVELKNRYVDPEDVDDGEQLADDILDVGKYIDALETAEGLLEVGE